MSAGSKIDARYAEEVSVFGPPFAYYKDRTERESPSLKLFFAGFLITVVCALDFLLATNILIYVRTMNPNDTRDIFVHSAIVVLSLLLIWVSYKFLCWYIAKFQITDTLKEHKIYKKIANDVIELENLLTSSSSAPDRRLD